MAITQATMISVILAGQAYYDAFNTLKQAIQAGNKAILAKRQDPLDVITDLMIEIARLEISPEHLGALSAAYTHYKLNARRNDRIRARRREKGMPEQAPRMLAASRGASAIPRPSRQADHTAALENLRRVDSETPDGADLDFEPPTAEAIEPAAPAEPIFQSADLDAAALELGLSPSEYREYLEFTKANLKPPGA
jgi:hypothetical protein